MQRAAQDAAHSLAGEKDTAVSTAPKQRVKSNGTGQGPGGVGTGLLAVAMWAQDWGGHPGCRGHQAGKRV